MRQLFTWLVTWLGTLLRNAALPAEAGPLPLASGAMLSHEWLAPHLVCWPSRISDARMRDEA
ncbi:UNVERIFIED_ORG: hypothetical protein M2438_003148 [Methylobacterium sp. SuP10 SLI 274]|uniref:hypothetical protein n=1 Tax=Methylorubrum extorquens TaxID=408 RepID=UPI00209D7E83|nr:hypothetical protein [Methylorubrum extorquens]MDF9864385.1 hypothetical protein [Methylorubrum pseudosasae]MDH6637973.1 hypothetical protein [Methylobacterium sp. SuP10 SLI 274]MDH6667155.1 hypothetical protein [Methylorubrum zatmanii]MCP1559058.1 hypothetical protein [Methylorubrum extorquens]MDF9792694.1 hypothetical protein [Methylorubrum extorquens]